MSIEAPSITRHETEFLWLLDYDRTLGNPEVAIAGLKRACQRLEVTDIKALDEAYSTSERIRKSFDVVEYLVGTEKLTEGDVSQVMGEVVSQQTPDILYPDAKRFLRKFELLARVDGPARQPVILTQGNRQWQTTKLKLAGLEGRYPYSITDRGDKGVIVAQSRNDISEEYQLQTDNGGLLVARKVILVDDKEQCLMELPDDCDGIHVARDRARTESELHELPSNVTRVDDLAGIVFSDHEIIS
jgi:hypothetical protein